jgi:hypothetical protein
MKKILIITAIALTANLTYGQEEGDNELKNFRFGLKITPSINWSKPDGKIILSNGPVLRYGGGLITEFRLSKVVSVETGVQIDVDGGKLKYNNGGPTNANANTVSYYYYGLDDKIAPYDPILSSNTSYTHYQLNERNYRVTYITIPLALKMKTKEIGDMTYYGQIGMNNSFRWRANADDELQVINDMSNTLGAKESKTKVDITKDVTFYTASLNFGIGSEINFSGSTSLTFGLNYNLGFTNVVKNYTETEPYYLARRANNADYNPISNSSAYTVSSLPKNIKSNAILITIGVLF